MTIQPLSQRDPRWARKYLGFSKLTIGSYGCTLTSLTMLLSHVYGAQMRPDEVNEKLKSVGAFIGALLYWSKVQLAYPKIKFNWRGYNYDNLKVAWNIYVKGMPVMVEVNAAKIGAPKHWVLYLGGQKINDPWVGKTEPTNKYPATGYTIYTK